MSELFETSKDILRRTAIFTRKRIRKMSDEQSKDE
jgi:hypothetical protein